MAKASELVRVAQSWVGKKESDGSHKAIIDIYNGHKPLARGYKVKYTDAWCATTMSALAIACKATDIIPLECGCGEMIKLAKNMGIWVENENRVPSVGELIMYDWNDGQNYATTDNTGWPEHVGIVEKVVGNTITVIEGNKNNAVERRSIAVNGKYIRGYITPKYEAETVSKLNAKVLKFQKCAIADGFKFPKYGADGEWGDECRAVAKNAIIKERKVLGVWVWKYPNLTKLAQELLGFTGTSIDGKCGKATGDRIEKYQNEHGLQADRCIGLNTWEELLEVK